MTRLASGWERQVRFPAVGDFPVRWQGHRYSELHQVCRKLPRVPKILSQSQLMVE